MGSFYGNVTLLGTDLLAVRAASPRPGFAFSEGDAVVVFAEADDEGAPTSGATLSAALDCVAFSAGVHDDDIFFFEVHDHGRSVMSGALPDPVTYFGADAEMLGAVEPSMLEAPDPSALVEAVGRGDVHAVRTAFEADYVFASERHQAIVEALRLPLGAAGWGYRYLASDSDDAYSGPPLTAL